jgi:16S rRNA G527 N7-methylase RsmG
MRVLLVEASRRKADFLEEVAAALPAGRVSVLCKQVQRAEDLEGPPPACLASRAMGNWARVVPRVARALPVGGRVLLWAGEDAETIFRREAWRDLRVVHQHAITGRDRSWIWALERADHSVG